MPVGFGFSIGDIINCGKLAREIYINCFTEAQAAHVKYAQFRQSINSLAEGLKQLVDIINNASNQNVPRPWRSDADPSSSIMRVLSEVTGDFELTLKDCRKLLRSHANLQSGQSNAFTNLAFWSSGAERDIDNLMSRVSFHATKIALVSKPFETQLLVEIGREVQRLRQDIIHLTGIVTNGVDAQSLAAGSSNYLRDFEIPEAVTSRFEAALQTHAPLSYTSNVPIREGFDALVFNFAKSTVEFNAMPRLGQNAPEGLQYLNLLKSIWIMKQIKDSSEYPTTGSDSLWADCMRELEDDIRSQIRRFESGQIIKPPYESYSRLPPACFTIWVEEKPLSQPPDLAEQGPLEEKILELPLTLDTHLTTRNSTLTVMRRSEVEYRLVTTTKQADNPLFHSEESFPVNMGFARLIPAYATNVESFAASTNLALCNDQGQFPQWYTLKSYEHIEQLQQALTGYRVHYSMAKISWRIDSGDSGIGSLQMWQHKPLRGQLQIGSPAISNENASFGSHSPPGNGNGIAYMASSASAELYATPFGTHNRVGSTSTAATVQRPSTLPQSDNTLSRMLSGTNQPAAAPPNADRRSNTLSRATFASHGSVQSRISGPRSNGVELVRSENPVLLLFTVIQGKHAFLHLTLKDQIFVNPKACSCRNPLKNCKRIVLESKERKFKLRRLVASKDDTDDLFSWDMAHFRRPRPSKFQDVKVMAKVKTLTLSFESVKLKDDFLKEVDNLIEWRDYQHNLYVEALREARRRGMRASR